ncbi:MAG TPA: TldD/PmbA family protein [Candidatus Obscuribacterales bacterium]
MLSKRKAREILEDAIRTSPADETEVILSGGKTFSTRFTNNYISQNGAQKEYDIAVRVAFGQQVGVASCNIFDGDNLKQVVENACTAARHSKPDLEWTPVLEAREVPELEDAYLDSTIDYTPEEKAERLAPVLKRSIERGLTSAGMLVNGDNMLAVMNSRGLFGYQSWTGASFTYTAMAPDQGSAWAEYHSHDLRELEVEALADQAMERADLARHPVATTPGAYTVVLAPTAVIELVEFLNYLGFGGQGYSEGTTFTSGKMGEQLFHPGISLIDDPSRREVLGPSFDYEGHPKQRLALIDKGTISNIVYDRRTARKAGAQSTGHALMPPATSGPFPTNIILEAGDTRIDDMVANTERGIYVTRFWYSNVVDPKQAIITGMTRDGTFLIEDGKLSKPLRNMRYNQSLLKAFANVEAIGDRIYGFNGYFGKLAVPALKIRDFVFSSVSEESPS